MSGWRLVTITCDHPGCGWWEDRGVADTAAQARKQLKGSGWQLNVRDPRSNRHLTYPTLDYCPQHTNNKED